MPHHNRPKRVLMTADTVGGVWQYALELSQALQPEYEVVLATMGAPLDDAQRRDVAAAGIKVHESAYKLEWMADPWDDVSAAGDWLLELERRLRPDVIHLNNYAHGNLPWQAPTLLVGHSCVLSWWRAVKGADAPDDWAEYRSCVRAGLQAVNAIAAPTAAMLQCLRLHYGPLPGRQQIIYNARRSAGAAMHDKEAFFLSAGRLWDEGKNMMRLAEAAASAPWPVCLAGDSDGPDGAAARFNNVRMLGRLDSRRMQRWQEKAAVYVHPAAYEPFGLCVLEAALNGCALVLSDIPSLRELWSGAALFVAHDDAAAIAGALQEIAADDELRTALARQAQRRARRYSIGGMAAAYKELYRRLESIPSAARVAV